MMFLQGISEAVAARALNSIPAGIAIAALAWLGVNAFRKQGSRVAFAVWFLALMGIAAVPLVPSFEAAAGASGLRARVTLPGLWADVIFGGWLSITGVAGLRLLVGMGRLWVLKRSATPIPPSDLPEDAQRVIAEFRTERPVEVCISRHVRVPTAVGFFKPAVLLPEWALTDLSAKDLNAVLLHELAHLRRRDDWTNLAQKVLGAVFFFHPAIWWVERKLALEREMACDELVLASTGNRQAYAECLVSLAEKSFARRGLALAQSVIGHAKSTALRLTRILNPGVASKPSTHKPALAVASAVLVCCILAAPGAPKWIAFQARAVPTAVAAMNTPADPASPINATKIEAGLKSGRDTRAPQHRATAKPSVARVKPAPAPALVARQTESATAPGSATQFLVVMQTTVDDNGEVKTNWRVWKLTLRESDNRAIRAQIVASSL